MKILHINPVYGIGSTGRNTEELIDFLDKNGHKNYIAYAHGTCSYTQNFKYGSWVEKKWHALYSRLFGKQGMCAFRGTKHLLKYIDTIEPDVIQLNNIHGNHLNFPLLFEYFSHCNYPIVWTLHDCWSYTGICYHYTAIGCYKWKEHCKAKCPKHHPWIPEFGHDRVKEMFELKKKYFTSIDKMVIIPVSEWLAGEVSQSFLSKYPIVPVYNWVDSKKFKTIEIENIREKYKIPSGKKVVLSVSANWDKNSSKYRDAIALNRKLSEDYCMVLVGSLTHNTKFPSDIIHISYLNNTEDLAKIYNAALVYVHLSVEDTFGKVIAEAMACGTPVIVYESTAMPELVEEGCGFVVQPHEVGKIFEKVKTIDFSGKDSYSRKCIDKVNRSFNSEKNMEKYLQIYKGVVK